MPQNQRKHHAQEPAHLCRGKHRHITTQMILHEHQRNQTFQEIHDKHRNTPTLPQHTHRIGSTDVTRTVLAQINTIQTPGNIAKRNRTNQVCCDDI